MRAHPYILALVTAALLPTPEGQVVIHIGNPFARIKAAWSAFTAPSTRSAGTAGWGDVVAGLSGSKSDELANPYAVSVWVQRAIKHVAGPIAAVPLKFGTTEENPTENPELAEWWRHPAIGAKVRNGKHRLLSYPDFIEATAGWMKLKGDAFWVLDDSWLVPFPESRATDRWPRIIVARPDRMTEVTDGAELVGWLFSDAGGRRVPLLPEQVIQIPFWNPYHDFRGLGEMGAANVAANADYLAGKYGLHLMKENGDRGPYIVFKGSIADDKQRDQIIAQLREKRAAALRGEFKPTFLSGGDFSIEDPKTQTMDTALVSQRVQNRHEIFVAFGVPPSMSDIVASYSVGSASDRYLLIEETCMPLGVKIAEHIAALASRMTGKPLVAWLEWDDHSVMRQVRSERIKSAKELWDMGCPLSVASDYLGMALPEHPGSDKGYLPFSVTPVEMIGEVPDKDPDLGEPIDADPVEEAADAIERAFASKRAESDPFQRKRDPKEVARWRHHMAGRKASEKAYESGFRGVLMEARRETLANLERVRTVGGVSVRAAASDIIFSLAAFTQNLLAKFRKASIKALQDAGEQVYGELKKDDPWVTPPAEVTKFMRERENKISGASQEVFDAVRDEIQAGIDAGESTAKLGDRIRGAFNDAGKARAKTIAITETSSAFGQGRQAAMLSAGVQFKQWLTSGNDNVRPAHADANGQTVAITDPFDVGGEALLHPGDPHGSASNVINCHCVSIAVEAPEDA